MLRPAILISAVLLAAAGRLETAAAQPAPQRGTLRGVVRSSLGDPIPYAVVALEPGFPRRFSDDSGSFVFPRIAPRTYHLLARQVGYKPLDTTVVVLADSTVVVAVALEHLVVELAEIRVTAELSRASRPSRCTEPGPPDPARTPELAAIFDQLKQNAERYWMLADSYPVAYTMERRRGSRGYVTSVDTLDLRTDTRWHYAPGNLISDVAEPHGGKGLQVNLPTLPDFADSVFDRTHCFRLIGLDTLEGNTYVRIDFRPDERLIEPDADGSAYLDPSSYLVRGARIRLTHPERVGLASFTAQVGYREVAPAIAIVESITADQSVYQGPRLVQHREEQRLQSVFFLRRLPKRP